MANCAITSADRGMVSTTTPLERSESRDHRAGIFPFPLLSGFMVKFHFKTDAVRSGKEMRTHRPYVSTRLLQITSVTCAISPVLGTSKATTEAPLVSRAPGESRSSSLGRRSSAVLGGARICTKTGVCRHPPDDDLGFLRPQL